VAPPPITRDILVFLPSFNSGRPTGCGNELSGVPCAGYVFAQGGPRAEAIPATKSGPQTVRLVSRVKGVLDPFQLCASTARGLQPPDGSESDELVSMRCQVVDALAINLPASIRIAPSDAQAWRSCEMLLRTCQQVGGP
ncbi:hypothetical protein BGW80DRAFT_1407729, partial [Lactifluus volemus]